MSLRERLPLESRNSNACHLREPEGDIGILKEDNLPRGWVKLCI